MFALTFTMRQKRKSYTRVHPLIGITPRKTPRLLRLVDIGEARLGHRVLALWDWEPIKGRARSRIFTCEPQRPALCTSAALSGAPFLQRPCAKCDD
jgi:hypothetical protein